jgi:molecular chaperone HscA
MQLLRDAIAAQDKNKIQHQTEELNNVSRPYAERVMEGALKDAMRGKKVI